MIAFLNLPEIATLQQLSRDGRLLMSTRMVRLFAYGFVAVVLALYFAARGLDTRQIGLLISATLAGDVILSLWITLIADRIGRRRMLMVGAWLMIFAGLALALSDSLILLVLAAVIGTISPTGSEVGPFTSVEQAALPETIDNRYRTPMFAWYNLSGSVATACGALFAGVLAGALQRAGLSPLASYRLILLVYAALGLILFYLYTRLSSHIEVAPSDNAGKRRISLHRSRGVVLKLSALFMIDSFGGSMVLQSVLAYWLSLRFGVQPETLGGIFFGVNLLAGISALAAGRLAARIGLVNTMVWTHLPSNILLMLVPLMPTLPLAALVLLVRYSISQMDVPTRQSYIMAVVDPDERSAAAGVTTLVRTAASAAGPALTGVLFGLSLFSAPFFIAGTLKIGYDLALWRSFRALKPPEEQ